MNSTENLFRHIFDTSPNLRTRWMFIVAALMIFVETMISQPQPAVGAETAFVVNLQEQQEREKEQWISRLKAAPEGSRWYVGANFGRQLSALPDDQAFEILSACWSDIADSVRPQILKGFTPGFKKTDGTTFSS